MDSHLERLNRFESLVPQAFLRDIVVKLQQLYPSTYARTEGLPSAYQRYLVCW